MAKIKVFKLLSSVTDIGTGMRGMLTHSIHFLDGSTRYSFQPEGLDNDGQPLKRHFVESSRFEGSNPPTEEIDIPQEVLGSTVRDVASGYTGTAIQIIRHCHGCLHVFVQSQGKSKDGNPVAACDFNLIQLEGEKVPKLTDEEKKEERKQKPSPDELPAGPIM